MGLLIIFYLFREFLLSFRPRCFLLKRRWVRRSLPSSRFCRPSLLRSFPRSWLVWMLAVGLCSLLLFRVFPALVPCCPVLRGVVVALWWRGGSGFREARCRLPVVVLCWVGEVGFVCCDCWQLMRVLTCCVFCFDVRCRLRVFVGGVPNSQLVGS